MSSDSVWDRISDYAVRVFDIDFETCMLFTEGGCFDLAFSLGQELNFPVKCIYSYRQAPSGHISHKEQLHAVVELPSGLYLDILGIWDRSGLLKFWYDYEVEISKRNSGLKYDLEECLDEDYERVDPDELIPIMATLIKNLI